jgi:hypothetical protein
MLLISTHRLFAPNGSIARLRLIRWGTCLLLVDWCGHLLLVTCGACLIRLHKVGAIWAVDHSGSAPAVAAAAAAGDGSGTDNQDATNHEPKRPRSHGEENVATTGRWSGTLTFVVVPLRAVPTRWARRGTIEAIHVVLGPSATLVSCATTAGEVVAAVSHGGCSEDGEQKNRRSHGDSRCCNLKGFCLQTRMKRKDKQNSCVLHPLNQGKKNLFNLGRML